MVVGRGTKYSTLYITHTKIVKDVIHGTEFVDGTDLWHKRLCHMSKKGTFVFVRCIVLCWKDTFTKKFSWLWWKAKQSVFQESPTFKEVTDR